MSQHFLLSAAARTLSLRAVYAMGEEKAYETFCKLRWSETEGAPVCPRCGCLDAYRIPTRRKFKCAGCYHQFSVTSGTIFGSRKMSFTDLLAAITIFANAVKGISALQLARDLDCQHKTAFVLAHKIREAMAAETKGLKLTGEVEIDGAYFGGHVRPANKAEDRVDRRLAEHKTGKRRVVVALRQRKGRTLTFVVRSEADGVYYANIHLEAGTVIHADEAPHWDVLQWRRFVLARINHSEAYSADGICTNQAESYFSRLRRMIGGQHHHVSPQYLHQYASEAAWKEDHRRLDNGALTSRTIRLAMAHRRSQNWCGYWQRAA
jgi:transposase-like protein